MPYHMDEKTKKAVDKVKGMSIEKRIGEKQKRKPKRIFEKKPPNSHIMDGVVMSGAKHSSKSKVIGKMGKGSKAMKDKMAKLRAMRKKK